MYKPDQNRWEVFHQPWYTQRLMKNVDVPREFSHICDCYVFFSPTERADFILYFLSTAMRYTHWKISVHERGTSAKQGQRTLL